ncbi:MAG TPA: oligosaccharide flippase family protein, partial [Vitreimonas sp.]|nr:oligosaccharide flippase family protein [Vitreimonas sp.]
MNLARALSLAPLQIAQALVGLGAIAAFTRLMSAEEFGQYALALSASMLAHTLLFTWAEAAAFRFLPAARAEGRLKDHFATLLLLALALCVAVLAATGAVLTLIGFEHDILALCAFAAGAAVLRFIIRIARESDRAALDVGRYAIFETAYLLIGFALGVALLVRFDLGAAAPFAGLLLAGAVVLFVDAPRLFSQARGGAASAQRAASYATYGAPLALALAIDLAVQTIARFVLAAEAGAGEVGAYAAAFGLARPLDLLFIAAGAAISPLLLIAHENKGASAVAEPARNGVTLMAAIAFPAAVGLAFVAAPLSTLLIGQALSAEAGRALPWLAVAGVASGFNLYYLSEAFQLTRRTGLRALVMLIPGAVQLVLTAALAGAHGATGAAMAAAAGAGVGSIALFLVGRRFIALPLPLDALARAATATAIMS